MSNPAIVEAITHAAEALDVVQQQRVLAYIHSIKARPPGGRPESLLKMVGAIPLSDCDEFQKAIDEGCGQVNLNAW
jgi:hypothetical protein